MYTEYRTGKITQKEYVERKMKNEECRQELEGLEENLKEQLKTLEKMKGRYLKAIRALVTLKSCEKITAEMVSALVEKIYVYPGRRVEIKFQYTNEMLEGGGLNERCGSVLEAFHGR